MICLNFIALLAFQKDLGLQSFVKSKRLFLNINIDKWLQKKSYLLLKDQDAV